jgi:hypothetical protein
MAEELITSPDGLVAIRYYQTLPHVVGVGGDKSRVEYAFVVKNNICIGWVKPEDVDKVLAVTKNCCGNNRKQVYFPATEHQFGVWSGIYER